MDKEQFLETWKDLFLFTVYQASHGFLAPDSEDVICVRELLIKEVPPLQSEDDNQNSNTTPNEEQTVSSHATKKRSPRSPRSVIGMSSARFRGSGSFFSRSSSSNVLASPYDARRTSTSQKVQDTPVGFRAITSSRLTSGTNHRSYFKQVSAPLPAEHHLNAAAFAANMSQFPARASTPEVPQWRHNDAGTVTSEYERGRGYDCWRSNAFEPPPFFSA
jgi:hypothetical protein